MQARIGILVYISVPERSIGEKTVGVSKRQEGVKKIEGIEKKGETKRKEKSNTEKEKRG